MSVMKTWLWDRSAFMLAVFVLGGLVLGWFLPATEDVVFAFAICQIVMAVVVLVKESWKLSSKLVTNGGASARNG